MHLIWFFVSFLDVHVLWQVMVSSIATPHHEEEALYASPEELLSQGTAASPKSDVYSLGVLFFELFNPIHDEVGQLTC